MCTVLSVRMCEDWKGPADGGNDVGLAGNDVRTVFDVLYRN